MIATLYTAPTAEPITLSELKDHLRVDSGTLADNLTESISIAPGSHAVGAGGYDLIGTGIAVSSDSALVMVQSGTNGATGTVDIKIQDSDDNATWTDWTGGAFAQITTANDNAVYEKEYTGVKAYIRVICRILLAACEFGVTVINYLPTSAEDDLLTMTLAGARKYIEEITRRQLMTATWDYFLQRWPDTDRIKLPFGNLVSVTHLKYKDSDGTETTLVVTTDYLVETNGDMCGYLVLPYGESWPSDVLYPSNPIYTRFVCGYTSAANVPEPLKIAIKFTAQNIWKHGGNNPQLTELVNMLCANYRLWDTF